MSSKTLMFVLGGVVVLVIGVAGYLVYARFDDRNHDQEGFKRVMEKKIHGQKDLFDGFTTDPMPAPRRAK
jgi:hypothetical protein